MSMVEPIHVSDPNSPRGEVLAVGPSFTPFSDRQIPEDCLKRVFESARLAPSEWNFQPWRWIVVSGATGKALLQESTYIQAPLATAPVLVVCISDTLAWKSAPQHLREMVVRQKISEEDAREVLRKIREYYSLSPVMAQRAALASAFMALHQIVRAAADCELAADWVSEVDEERIKKHFNVPDNFLVSAVVALGYRENSQASIPKLPLRSLVYQDKFGVESNLK
jgi:nitroreductase